MDREYRSRIDWWVGLSVALGPVACLGVFGLGLSEQRPDVLTIGAVLTVFMAALFAGLLWPLRYHLSAAGIQIRMGMIRIAIPWDRLDRAELSSSPLSGAAMSLRRIRIEYRNAAGKNRVALISPPDREAFLTHAAELSPRHELHDGALQRSES